ncbi:MAG: hypothetical protein JWQ64_947 [Subtercola sp.]|nr:hypothetical protein [Subtercola sp.]
MPGYDIIGELGHGRRSRVYLATPHDSPQPLLDRVVVKLYDAEAAESARRLARLWQSLDSPYCPQFLDEQRTPTGIAIVSPWARCGSLAELLARRRSTLRLGEAITILAPLAQLLAAVHGAGEVHGALEAGNVLFDESGRPVLVGWGRGLGEASSRSEALQFVTLCREVLAACEGVSQVAETFLGAQLAALDAVGGYREPGDDMTGDDVIGNDPTSNDMTGYDVAGDRELYEPFFEAAEDALFLLAEPCPIDPLQPYDWAADAATALAGVDAEIDTLVAENRKARRAGSRLRAATRSAIDGAASAGRRVARERTVRLWPGHRGSIRLKTIALAAIVGSVALAGALMATPTSSVTAASADGVSTGPASTDGVSTGPVSTDGASTRTVPAGPVSTDGVSTDGVPTGSTPTSAPTGSVPPGGRSTIATPVGPGSSEAAGVATSTGRDATGDDSGAQAVVAGDDAVAALTVLLNWREGCFHQSSADCFSAVDQPQSAALANDQTAYAETKRAGADSSASWLDISTDGAAVAQQVGNAVLTTVVVSSEPGGSDAVTKKPASALLVKGETGWRIREIFTPPG